MDWQTQREQWNREGKCAREACKASFVRRGRRSCGKHRHSGLEYCVVCTRLINEMNPMADGQPLVVWSDTPVAPVGPLELPELPDHG